MGEVYRATDTTLGREVAIKVLPPEVAGDTERLGRFKREAHVLASLNHPHIAAIYGLEEADGRPFLALELVEGEDLRQRLARGAIPVDEALEIARQVADALEEAHGKGIVHRDLKPANVKLTPDGKVKVLDFGLAKAWAGEAADGSSASSALSQSPTLAHTGTMAGVILGTAAYMSPEQARGKPVDKRGDVWSFGVLLWEMLTGRALFAGDTVTDVIAEVVTKEPDLDALPKTTPGAVRRLLSRCLRKDLRTRLPDIGAARLELQEIVGGASTEMEAPRVSRRDRARERWIWVAVALLLAGLSAVLVLGRRSEAPEPRPPAHFVLDSPQDLSFWDYSPVALSPDGRHLVITATSAGGKRHLWIRSLDAPEVRALPGTEGALGGHFWSPDSASIVFAVGRGPHSDFPGGELRKLTLVGGTVQRLCALPAEFNGGAWSPTGAILISAGRETAVLYAVPPSGGEASPFTSLDAKRGETNHHWPQFLPDGRVLFVVGGEAQATGLHVLSMEAPTERRRILPHYGRFQFVAPGHLLFLQARTLLAQRFDPEQLVLRGEAVPLASSVAVFNQVPSWGFFSSSVTGRLAWADAPDRDVRLEWVDREGRQVDTLGEPGRYGQVTLSPDDKRVAAEIADADGQYDLWVIDVARGVPSRLTTDPANERDPVWSPDSRELVYSSDASGQQNLLRKELHGSAPAAPLPGGIGQSPREREVAKEWSREGNALLFLTIGTERTLWELSLDGGGPPQPLVKGFFVDQPHVSPDGRWLAFISQESGRSEVYVEPFHRRGERVRVSVNGGGQPRWRGDGGELFFLSLDGGLMSVAARNGATGLEVELPTTLIPAGTLQADINGPDFTDYAVTSDGRRFLVKRPVDLGNRQRIHVLLDWTSLLK